MGTGKAGPCQAMGTWSLFKDWVYGGEMVDFCERAREQGMGVSSDFWLLLNKACVTW